MPKKIILHAGIHKTGTTALQIILGECSDLLLNKAILYPKAGRRDGGTAHHLLASAFAQQIKPEKIISAFVKECEDFDGTVVISSEEFCLFSPEAINSTINLLKLIFDEVSVIFYLRPQALIVYSQYSQQIREGYLSIPFNEFFEEAVKYAEFWQFKQLCQTWIPFLKPENFFVRSALKQNLINKDIVQDFFGTFLNTVNKDIIPNIPPQNTALTLEQINIIRNIIINANMSILPFSIRRKLLENFINTLNWSCSSQGSTSFIPRYVMTYCHDNFKEDNLFLTQFFGENLFEHWYLEQLSQ